MDLLGKHPAFDLSGSARISARNSALPSTYVAREAKTVDCLIAEGGVIHGSVRHSVISTGCTIGAGAMVEDSVLMPGVTVEPGAIIRHAIVGEDTRVCKGAVIGGAFGPSERKKISVVGKDSVVEENAVVVPGEIR